MTSRLEQIVETVDAYLLTRITEYCADTNIGPGPVGEPIRQVTLGFDCDEIPWLAMVFDTRCDAAVDGEWNGYIEKNRLDIPELTDLLADEWSDKQRVTFIGDLLRESLVRAFKSVAAGKLSLADEFCLTVEHHDGRFGWSNCPSVDTGDEEYLGSLDSGAAALLADEQISYWINVLHSIASGKEEQKSEWAFLAQDHVLERLEPFGERAVIPLLQFVCEWSGRPEFKGDFPSEDIEDEPFSSPCCAVLQKVSAAGLATGEVQALLREIVKRSVGANQGRELWGTLPFWAADALAQLFPGYPEPQQDDSTNRLINTGDFL